MASTFGGLDTDSEQRRKMIEVVDLFQEEGTVDELGIGSIRDALADSFPCPVTTARNASTCSFVQHGSHQPAADGADHRTCRRSRTVMSSASLAVSNSSAARASTTGGLFAASTPEPMLALFGDSAT